MNIEEFIEKVGDSIFEDPQDITIDSELDDLLGWDSIGRLGIIAMYNEYFDKKVDTKQLKTCKKISDLVDLVKGDIEF